MHFASDQLVQNCLRFHCSYNSHVALEVQQHHLNQLTTPVTASNDPARLMEALTPQH